MNAKKIVFVLCLLPALYACLHSAPRLRLCTVATDNVPGFISLKNCCAEQRLPLEILGMGQEYPGNYIKIVWVKKYIQNLPKNDILLFIDGYDVLVLAEEQEIIEKFLAMKALFVIGAEPVLSPQKIHLLAQYPKSSTRFRYINSGCYIGYIGVIEKILDGLLRDYEGMRSDQWRFHEHYLKNRDLYKLDHDCKLFLNVSRVPMKHLKIDLEKKRIYHKPTQTTPIAVHGCGVRQPFIEDLGDLFFGVS